MRLSFEVSRRSRKSPGSLLPLGVRICLNEFTAFGYDLDYGLQMVQRWKRAGWSTISMRMRAPSRATGWRFRRRPLHPRTSEAECGAEERTTKLRSSLSVASPRRSAREAMLRSRRGRPHRLARQLIADPETPNKLAKRPFRSRAACIACNDACIYQVGQEKGDSLHSQSGRGPRAEGQRTPSRAGNLPRRIVIVGAGPAGLKVAEIAAKRGHKVTLLEREAVIGGQVRLAARQPEHEIIGEVTRYLEAAVSDQGVESGSA